jgi:hypothetical protein
MFAFLSRQTHLGFLLLFACTHVSYETPVAGKTFSSAPNGKGLRISFTVGEYRRDVSDDNGCGGVYEFQAGAFMAIDCETKRSAAPEYDNLKRTLRWNGMTYYESAKE